MAVVVTSYVLAAAAAAVSVAVVVETALVPAGIAVVVVAVAVFALRTPAVFEDTAVAVVDKGSQKEEKRRNQCRRFYCCLQHS